MLAAMNPDCFWRIVSACRAFELQLNSSRTSKVQSEWKVPSTCYETKFTKVAAINIIKTVNRINLERGSSNGQDKYINQATNAQTTESDKPENGGFKNKPRTINIAIKAGIINLGRVWIRSRSGALASVIFLRKIECVTTGTVGTGFFGLFLLLTYLFKHE